MDVVNIYPGGPQESWKLVLVHPDDSTSLIPCPWVYYVDAPGGRFDRIECRSYNERKSRLSNEQRPTYEGDLNPIRRYLADNPDVRIIRPRTTYLDMETDPRPGFANKLSMRILSVCCVGDDGARFTDVLTDDSDDAEAKLLRNVWAFLKRYQRLTAWSGGDDWSDELGFDFPVLRARTVKYWPETKYRFKRWLWQDQYLAYKRLKFEEAGEDKASLKLGDVGFREVGEGKHEYDAKQCFADWQAGGSRREKMVRYCEQDVSLCSRIEEASGILELGFKVCEACGVLPDTRGLTPTQFVDGYLCRLGNAKGQHFPTKIWTEGYRKKNFEGAYVKTPVCTGIVKDLYVLDFNSLYPSIIRTLNASPETKGQLGCVSPLTGVAFGTDVEGILPEACRVLMVEKARLKDAYAALKKGTAEYLKAKSTHDAFKAILNSFYGVVGSMSSRWFDKEIAESITLAGQFFIRATEKAAEAEQFLPRIGDTDSLGMTGRTLEQAHEFVKMCNTDLYPSIAKNHRCRENHMRLAFDKHFERFVCGVKDDGTPAKKKYVGRYAETGKLSITGFEYKRGDASPLARALQKRVAEKLMVECSEDPEDFPLLIIEARNRILHEPLPLAELVVSEGIREELDSYVANSPAISAARIMAARGEDVSPGTKIRYIVTDGSVSPVKVIPASDFVGQYDAYYIWERQVYKPTQRLLMGAFPEYDWEQFADVRPKQTKEQKFQEKCERKGQIRLPFC